MENSIGDPIWLFSQLLGLSALILVGVRWLYYQDDVSGNLRMKILGSCLLAMQFYLLGALTGCVIDLLSALQAYVFYRFAKNGNRYRKAYVPILFSLLFIVVGVLTWTDWRSLLPIMAAILFVIADSQETTSEMAKFQIAGLVSFLLYDLATTAYGGFCSDLVSLLIVCVYKFYLNKKRMVESC